MVRSVALATVLSAVLAPLAHAQVNIDQDKTPASIYQSDCAVCHKSVRGLANGRGSSALTSFLAEHYTSSQQEAAALAAYVLAGGGGSGMPAPVRGDNPKADHAAATDEPSTHEVRRQVKPEGEPAAGAKPPRRAAEHGKPAKPERTAIAEPGSIHGARKPSAERHGSAAAPAQHGRLRHADAPPPAPSPATPPPVPSPAPAQVAAAPKPAAAAKPNVSPPALAPSAAPVAPPPESPPAEALPTSRDNIPD